LSANSILILTFIGESLAQGAINQQPPDIDIDIFTFNHITTNVQPSSQQNPPIPTVSRGGEMKNIITKADSQQD
ncbi:hypothetical protein A2U01_0084349, partial [Trifolium medium]|nr:hypothetical protein [Trifolium medium]